MSTPISTTPPSPSTFVVGGDPTVLHETLTELRKTTSDSITKALTELGTVNAIGVTTGKDGILQLAPPKGIMNVMDLTLRIGLLQDALNQLQQAVSKNEIQGRLNDLKRENKEQLDKFHDQMKHVEEQVKKNQEAAKKANMFGALGFFFKAIIDAIMAVFNIIAAVGYALTGNVAAAAGLIVSAAALMASAAINVVEGINSTVMAAGGKGFLSEADIQRMNKASEILGYVAMGAAMIGGLGALVEGVSKGASLAAGKLLEAGLESSKSAVMKTVLEAGGKAMTEFMEGVPTKLMQKEAQELAEKVLEEAMEKGVKQIGSRVIQDTVKEAIKDAVKQTFKTAMRDIMEMTARITIASAVVGGASKIIDGVGDIVVANIKQDAAAEKKLADEAEAKAKAIEAMIQMLHKVIEQLQKDLSDMLDSMMQAVSAVFNAADETADSMKQLMHFQPN